MSGLNISVKPSETLAIVGTTDFNSNLVIALVERFYDPSAGCIVSIQVFMYIAGMPPPIICYLDFP